MKFLKPFLTRMIKHHKFSWLAPFVELIKFIVYIYNVLYLKRKVGYGNVLKFQNLQLSDGTCFILGSGSSVNDLKTSNWDQIRSNSSIGINSWLLHRFVPNLLVFECGRNQGYNSQFFKNLKRREQDYRNAALLWKDADSALHEDQYLAFQGTDNKLFFPLIFRPCSLREGAVPSDIFLIKILRNFFSCFGIPIFHYSRASIVLAIDMAVELGFKNIVLCGVDLNSTDYFWENPESKSEISSLVELPLNTGQEGQKIHSTIDPKIYPLTVDKVIYHLNDHYLKPMKVNLYVGSEKSALFPTLPCYPW